MLKLLALVGSITVGQIAADDATPYHIQTKVYAVVRGEQDAVGATDGDLMSFRSGRTEVVIGSGRVGGMFYVDVSSGDFSVNEEKDTIELLSNPSIITYAGMPASIEIEQEAQYMVRNESGSFDLKSVDCGQGVFLGIQVNELDTSLELESEITVTSVVDRMPVEGVHLMIGKPITDSTTIKRSLRVPLDVWAVTYVDTDQDGDGLLVAQRVSHYEAR